MPKILPTASFAAPAKIIAKQTSILQRIPLITAVIGEISV